VVLEDDAVQLQVMSLQLQAQGLEPHGCTSPEEALRQIAAMPPGPLTVLMDLRMPQMQPREFCRQARAVAPQVRIVGCSASQPEADIVAALDQFLLKPVDGATMARAIVSREERKEATGKKPSASVTAPAVDLHGETFDTLARSMSPAMLRALYAAYFTDAEQRMLTMRVAQAGGDAEAMKRSAHTLKGASGMLGVQAVAQAAFAVETLAASVLAEAPLLLDELQQRLDRAHNATREKLDTLSASANIAMVSPTAEATES
jgi:CheY-like chemotaxis protein